MCIFKWNKCLVPGFGGPFFHIFGQSEEEFSTTVILLVNKNKSNQFYICISVVGIVYIYFWWFYIVTYKCVYYVVRSKFCILI